jgi:hypothetical protein
MFLFSTGFVEIVKCVALLIQIRSATPSLEKIPSARQGKSGIA